MNLDLADAVFNVVYKGERTNVFDSKTTMDEWACTFTRGEQSITFGYFTGIGCRKLPEWKGPGPVPSPRCIAGAARIAQAKPQAPSPADVLQSVLMDAAACDQSFKSWCGDFGYDTDSRKAFATYEACQRSGGKLRGFFTPKELALFTAELRDY